MDPVLEISVDDSRLPVRIRLHGVLDCRTRRRFLAIMDGLLHEGLRVFVLQTGDLEVADSSGAAALALCRRRVRQGGGTLTWDGVDLARAGGFVDATGPGQPEAVV